MTMVLGLDSGSSSADVLAYVRARIGTLTPPTDDDILALWTSSEFDQDATVAAALRLRLDSLAPGAVPGGAGYQWSFSGAPSVEVRTGATSPALEVTITDDTGAAQDLTGWTAVAVITDWQGLELRRTPAFPDPDQVGHRGWLSYLWQPTDVATEGNYGVLFSVTMPDGETSIYPSAGLIPYVVSNESPSPYVVEPTEVGRAIGVPTDKLTPDLLIVIGEMILDAQGDAEAYLMRPVMPALVTEVVAIDYTEPFGLALSYDAVGYPTQVTPLPNDPYRVTVTYVAGSTDRLMLTAVRRYVKAQAVEVFRDHPIYGAAYRSAFSLSADGQSISFGVRRTQGNAGGAGQTAAGTPPALQTLHPWQRRGVFSRRRLIGPMGTSWWDLSFAAGSLDAPTNPDGTVADGWVRNTTTGEVTPPS